MQMAHVRLERIERNVGSHAERWKTTDDTQSIVSIDHSPSSVLVSVQIPTVLPDCRARDLGVSEAVLRT